MPLYHVADALVEITLSRNGLQGLVDDTGNILHNECLCIHSAHEDAAVVSVPIVHDVAYLVRIFACQIRQSWAHDACIIGFYLIVDVVSVGIVEPVS